MGLPRWASVSVIAVAVAVAGSAAGSDLTPEAPPALPGAAVYVNPASAVVAQDGAVEAIDVVIGRTRWRSTQGRWPLASAQSWVAVAGPDTGDRRLLRVRFLRPTDGTVLADAKPIRLPAAINPNAWWE